MSVLSEVASFWTEGAIRTFNAIRDGFGAIENDPPAVTPYNVIYEGGKVSLRYYEARGPVRHGTPLLLVYALIKRPWILDLQSGRSVVENLTKQGFDLYLIDWIPPDENDTWRGFEAYVNGDVANAVRAVQLHSGVRQVSILGYCFGALLSLMYTALHQGEVKNLITLTIPLDMTVKELPMSHLAGAMSAKSAEMITSMYGNAPAWMMAGFFNSMDPIHHALNKFVTRYRNSARPGFGETFDLFEKWMSSDVPLAGKIFRELTTELALDNKLMRNMMKLGAETVDLKKVVCPLLNVIGELDDVVHPKQSFGLLDLVNSNDKRTATFPTGHMGMAVSGPVLKKLWPEIGKWLSDHD